MMPYSIYLKKGTIKISEALCIMQSESGMGLYIIDNCTPRKRLSIGLHCD